MGVRERARLTAPVEVPARSSRRIAAGIAVVLLRPRRLRGTSAIVQRRMTHGWEVEIRSADGLPMHLTVPERALRHR